MYELKFDANNCLSCQTYDCLTKCQYMDIDKDTAKTEMAKIINGEDSFVLRDCVTCYSCEEYCPMGNHPFYLIVERQEEMDIPPLPRPLIKRGVQIGIPFRGEPRIEEVGEVVLDMGVFADLTYLIQGKLFEGLPLISTDPRTMFHYFCQLMYLHYARASVIKERLPKIIKTIAKHNVRELGELGLSAETLSPLTMLEKLELPSKGKEAELISGSPEETADQLARILKNAGLF